MRGDRSTTRLKKTSVYLTQDEFIGLRTASDLTGRSQSSLLRQAVRWIARAAIDGRIDRDPPLPKDMAHAAREHSHRELTHAESVVLSYTMAGYAPSEIAEARRMSEEAVLSLQANALRKVDVPVAPLWLG